MRICIIACELAPYGEFGGIGTHVLTLAKGFAARGHQVTVAGFAIHEQRRILHDWGESLSLSLFPWLGPTWDRGRLRGALAATRFVRNMRGQFDVIETSNWGHTAFLPAKGYKYAARLSSSVLEAGHPGLATRFVYWLEKRACRRANLLLANSHATRRRATDIYACASVPCEVIYYGVADIPASAERPPTGRISIIYIGRAEHRKGSDIFIRALADVLPRCPNLEVTLIGGNFDDYAAGKPELRSLWQSLKAHCGERIHSVGRVDERQKCRRIAESHWLVLPSRFESFGQVVIEAMRAGTPVIAASGGALPEICSKGPGNLLYDPPENCQALAALLEEVCTRGEDYALKLRQPTRVAYLKYFTADRFVEESLMQYERLSGAGRPSSPPVIC
jgi:glycosyltransferase involved in cell wall biosynthesis